LPFLFLSANPKESSERHKIFALKSALLKDNDQRTVSFLLRPKPPFFFNRADSCP
jgi:hypothetical protein